MVRRLGLGKNNHLTYASLALNPRFEPLNKVGVKAIMDSKLEEQRSVIKFLLLEGEKPCHIFFQRLQKSFAKACISVQPFIAGFHS